MHFLRRMYQIQEQTKWLMCLSDINQYTLFINCQFDEGILNVKLLILVTCTCMSLVIENVRSRKVNEQHFSIGKKYLEKR